MKKIFATVLRKIEKYSASNHILEFPQIYKLLALDLKKFHNQISSDRAY